MTYHARRVTHTGLYSYPVPGCPVPPLRTAPSLRRHFRNRHCPDLVTTGGEFPLPVCGSCTMQVPDLLRHEQTQQCQHYTSQRRQHAAAATCIKAVGQRFSAYSVELTNVETFSYLGRNTHNNNDNTPAVQARLKKARASWARLGKVLRAENVSSRVSTMFYWATIQAVMLSANET